ncbi:MAG TPA: hypothetical protein DD414_10565 [Lachnospiraceae bacterium]|nr:hypothetical protein [Lachnospiraceae bacterium]
MNRERIKAKAMLLVVLTGFFIFLILPGTDRKTEEKNTEEAERLVIPGEEEQTIEPEETFEIPASNASIRVLLLGDGGSIYHEDKELEREYPGELIYYEEEPGWVIVNEVPLEEYLQRVVPSEMPSAYSEEALKAQAVCARTYAVWQLQGYAYPEYEAHVDDSVSYQVYNQVDVQESTDLAVATTAGQIMMYGDLPAKAYYFSTSCGSTTDENIWEKGSSEDTPYITARRVSSVSSKKDLTDEEDFERFIEKKHPDDLEISEPWYRWSCYVPLTQIEQNMEKWVKERAGRTQDGIMSREGDTYAWTDIYTAGTVKEVAIVGRGAGGVAQEMLVTGEDGQMKIKYEYNIRLMLGIPGGEVHRNDGKVSQGGNLLPSGYFVLDPVEEEGKLAGYQVTGGGLGHGAGMSQNGAKTLAEEGYGYDEILKYFYEGISLASLE